MSNKPAHALIDMNEDNIIRTLPKMDDRDRFVAAWMTRTQGMPHHDIAVLAWYLAQREWTHGNTSARDELNDGWER